MPRSKPDCDFNIYVDPSCLSTPMDEDTISLAGDVKKTRDTQSTNNASRPAESSGPKSKAAQEPHPSIETDDDDDDDDDSDADMAEKEVDGTRTGSGASSRRPSEPESEEIEGNSILSERTDRSFQLDDGDQSYVDHSEFDADGTAHTARGEEGDESSSQHEGTDEDVFTDKSPRSSLGSYDAGSESGKGVVDIDNMTTITTRSPRISDISQYDREDFIPTARGTPRPPFRTPSDVRAMQMSSPTASVLGSPRSSRKHFPTGSRLGTPSASAQYSPKTKSTPPRFKSRPEAPLVLLHVTLLPLRWIWGDLVNNLDPAEMSEQAKTLRDSWRVLQDRVGDTVIERGILLGHPQNDYEVLEERLLEALDLPVRRRARILECGHYLGPSNETTLTEDEESEDEYSQHRRQSATKRHWCATCKSEIRYDALGDAKVFRLKVYASNGLMRAGAWEACWKEMERVDAELEPVVEPAVQDEIVRLAAMQQEREIAQQEEAEIAKEVAMQFEEQRRGEELLQQEQARSQSSSPPAPEVIPEAINEHIRKSRSSHRRHRDEERLREIYGQTPPPPESQTREPSAHRPSPYVPASPPRSSEEAKAPEPKENARRGYQSASLPELLLRSARVLMQDRKNVVIFTLGLFVLILSLRTTPPDASYEPIIYRPKNMPEAQQLSVTDAPLAMPEQQRSMEPRDMEPIVVATPSFDVFDTEPSQASCSDETSESEHYLPHSDYYEAASPIIEQPTVTSVASEAEPRPTEDTFPTSASFSAIYEPCESPRSSSPLEDAQASSAVLDSAMVEEPTQEAVEETVHEIVEEVETTTEKTVVKIIQTVTRTETQTQIQIETQTEVETATAVETVIVKATEVPQLETASDIEEKTPDSQDNAVLAEDGPLNEEIAHNGPEVKFGCQTMPETAPETVLETVPETVPETVSQPVSGTLSETVSETVVEAVPESSLEAVPESSLEAVAEPTVEPEAVPVEA
ncbi:hypothetical protein F4803DRAFT_253186 [Xylaria telfairii]|nr:hypothetical protein F4803DRAFT_253186 [Xylaria telfairii]